jgi:hypothetical protein
MSIIRVVSLLGRRCTQRTARGDATVLIRTASLMQCRRGVQQASRGKGTDIASDTTKRNSDVGLDAV